MLILFENLSSSQADICALVLSSSGISYRLKKDRQGWTVWVDETGYRRALAAMQQYFRENRSAGPIPERAARATPPVILSGIVAALVLLLCHMAVNRMDNFDWLLDRFGASARDIVSGQVYRSVTALMLHADLLHLAGNMAGIALFGIAVCAVTGWGVGWLMILACGVAGNLVNAYMYGSGHISIGASTAVFGAVGILSGYQFLKKRKTMRNRLLAWMPLACGLALLGLLGSGGIRTDIAAHLFGFFVGIGMGFGYAAVVRFPPSWYYQLISIAAVVIIIAAAWATGWGFGP